LGSNADRALISVVTTVKNEEKNLAHLLDSLLAQEPPYEVVVIDALSRDRTLAIARSYEIRTPELIRVHERFGSRGMGRNAGVARARGEFVAFIDGDCVADSQWLQRLRAGFQRSDTVAGTTITIGSAQFGSLDRVELFQEGNDVTFPSCNLGYRRSLFDSLGGFDPRFITAEDIDLNLRAVQRGAKILPVPEARVYHQMRTTLARFLIQAFWNGYGRKQLTEKHGTLWGSYRVRRLLESQRTATSWARLVAAMGGYMTRVLTGTGNRLTPSTPEDLQAVRSAVVAPEGAARTGGTRDDGSDASAR
jgi:glycosyltransferase involved in cell wall biosynthesis